MELDPKRQQPRRGAKGAAAKKAHLQVKKIEQNKKAGQERRARARRERIARVHQETGLGDMFAALEEIQTKEVKPFKARIRREAKKLKKAAAAAKAKARRDDAQLSKLFGRL